MVQMHSSDIHYDKHNPFFARITNRFSLCKAGSQKNTQHIVLSTEGSGLRYGVGDSVAIFSTHDPVLVERTLQAMKAKGCETITDKQTSVAWKLQEYLERKANITNISRKLIVEVAKKQTDPLKKSALEALLSEDGKIALKEYQHSHELWDLLMENQEVSFTPEELCGLLMPLLPRFYSIASSMKYVGEELHLTVAMLKYNTNSHERLGVCTHYLCNLAPLNEPCVPIYIQPHHGFTLPEDPSASIIMVGPGTGVAPFRAFLQERMAVNAPGKNWLFFGERNRGTDYFYEEFWEHLASQGKLRIDLAFSRDQDHKVYVQHRLLEKGAEIFDWISNGAYLYVCGDAHHMARDVDAALQKIVELHGRMDEGAAKAYIKQLRNDKRFLKDVY
jgi:sulfite reductase (NADPH) flavoprotein alpha-component